MSFSILRFYRPVNNTIIHHFGRQDYLVFFFDVILAAKITLTTPSVIRRHLRLNTGWVVGLLQSNQNLETATTMVL
jgi:hypothetical protein